MTRIISAMAVIIFLLLSCTKNEYDTVSPPVIYPTVPSPSTGIDTASPRLFLALGDSYTIGQSVPESDRFPGQTTRSLTRQGINFGDPEIIARTGWTTADLLSSLTSAPPSEPVYDIVTLLIGVNNQYQHRTQQEYGDQFTTLLNMAIHYAGSVKQHVVVLSIPDYSVTPFASGSDRDLIAKEIDSFNVINQTLASRAGVQYLDITRFSRLAATNPLLTATDGLHPSGLEYKVWAEGLVPMIKKALQ